MRPRAEHSDDSTSTSGCFVHLTADTPLQDAGMYPSEQCLPGGNFVTLRPLQEAAVCQQEKASASGCSVLPGAILSGSSIMTPRGGKNGSPAIREEQGQHISNRP